MCMAYSHLKRYPTLRPPMLHVGAGFRQSDAWKCHKHDLRHFDIVQLLKMNSPRFVPSYRVMRGETRVVEVLGTLRAVIGPWGISPRSIQGFDLRQPQKTD